jgi:hypothetical protein
MPFQCSICGEESTQICARCTKDACDNHLCEKCRKCSDCCECEVALSPHAPGLVRAVVHPDPATEAEAPPLDEQQTPLVPAVEAEPAPSAEEPAVTGPETAEPPMPLPENPDAA